MNRTIIGAAVEKLSKIYVFFVFSKTIEFIMNNTRNVYNRYYVLVQTTEQRIKPSDF